MSYVKLLLILFYTLKISFFWHKASKITYNKNKGYTMSNKENLDCATQTREPKELDFYADLNDFLTTDEVAKILKVSNSYLAKLRFDSYNKDKDGNLRADFLPFFKAGKSIRYKKSDVLAWIERNMVRG